MEWYYAVEKQQHGPVSEAEFAELVRKGVITGTTLVWRKGMVNWIPYDQLAASQGVGSGDGPANSGAAQGAAVRPEIPDPENWAEQVKRADADVSVGECFGEGWAAFQRNVGTCIGVTLLFLLASIAIGAVPFLGPIAQIVLTGPLYGGLYYFFIVMVRGEECLVGNAFKGFGPQFVPLMLAGILVMVITFLCALPALGALIAGFISLGLFGAGSANPQQAIQAASTAAIIFVVVGILFSVCLMMIATVFVQFAYPLILDKGVDVITAIKLSFRRCLKVWLTLVLIAIAGAILNMIGALLCLVGLLFTFPWYMAALAVAYEKLFPGDTSRQNYY